jgi:ABC-type amino acid transport substrate-binding protein
MKTILFRITTAAVLVISLILSFGACGQVTVSQTTPGATDAASSAPTDAATSDPAEASAPAESATPAVSEEPADDAPTLIMVTNAEFPPYEFFENETIVGIDAEIAALIAEKIGMKLEIQNMNFDSLITAVQTGKADICMAGLTVREDRKAAVDFSNTYATGKQVVIVKEDSPIASPDDLEGKMMGVQQSTTGDIYITQDYVDKGLGQITRYNKGMDAVLALTQDKVDAVVIDNEPAKVFVSQNPGLKILETEYALEDYAVAVNKGKPELLANINAALDELQQSGELKAIIDKYINAN